MRLLIVLVINGNWKGNSLWFPSILSCLLEIPTRTWRRGGGQWMPYWVLILLPSKILSSNCVITQLVRASGFFLSVVHKLKTGSGFNNNCPTRLTTEQFGYFEALITFWICSIYIVIYVISKCPIPPRTTLCRPLLAS